MSPIAGLVLCPSLRVRHEWRRGGRGFRRSDRAGTGYGAGNGALIGTSVGPAAGQGVRCVRGRETGAWRGEIEQSWPGSVPTHGRIDDRMARSHTTHW